MKIKSYLKGIGFWVVTLTLTLSPMLVYADCQIVGTIAGGYIVACTGMDTDGFCIGDGNDIITVESGAEVSNTVQQWIETTASANAISIDAGKGNNQVTNRGSIGATADANALPIDGSVSQATANAVGISAEDGADLIQNSSTIAATATSDSESGDISLTLEGNTQSQSMTTSTAISTGIKGGSGNNQVNNSDAITVTATSEAEAPFIDLKLADTAKAEASVTAQATGIGISGEGSIVNQQIGTITVNGTSQATTGLINARLVDSAEADVHTTAQATTTGITGSVANDTITSTGSISVTATSQADANVDLETSTDQEINAFIQAESIAAGIDGGDGEDTITNQSAIGTTSKATANSDNINTSVWAPGVIDTTVTSIARSTGMVGGKGMDTVTNLNSITAFAEATTDVSNVLLSGGIEVALPTDVKGGATSEATSVGIDASDDDDQITNNSVLDISSNASTSSEGVLLTLVGIGTFATPTTATASSTGIDGGTGADDITNNGDIIANATSSAKALSVSVSALQYEAASDGDAKTESVASATGIAGGEGDDEVTHTGTITATANSAASTTDITVEVLGASRSNSSTTAESFATGINGGIGNDEISNSGTITASATSEVNAVGVDVKYISLPVQPAEWFGADLGDAKTAAQATATGIDSGEGDDTITNSSIMDASSNAKASSDKIIAMLNISSTSSSETLQATASGGNLQASPSMSGGPATMQVASVGAGNSQGDDEIADAGTIAEATASGIVGDVGNDTIINNDKLSVKAESEADSVSISATISIGKGSILDVIPDFAIIDATTTAQATATGIEGGSGNDTINNTMDLNTEAISNATSASVGVVFKGVTKVKSAMGIALSDATTKAFSTATGLEGGGGDDTITNSGKIKSIATSDADSASISVALAGAKEGLVGGVSYADATTTAKATATGIDAGGGNDTISNTEEIEVTADSTSSSASIGVSLAGAFSQESSTVFGVALTDGTTKAISNATGIKSGDDIDTIANSNKIKSTATSDADSASISVALAGAEDGLALGVSYADATTTAEANAIGIDGGSGNDTITNTGEIEVTAEPTASSASVSATITGVTKGTGIIGGAALTDGTTKAIGNATGISGGEGDDSIINSSKMIVKAIPDADSASVSVNLGAAMGELGLVGGFSYADATTTAEATAIGIDGGGGDDTITNTGEIEVTTEPTASSVSIGVTAQGVKGMGAAVGVSLTDGTTKAISNATGIRGGDGIDTITNSNKIRVTSFSDTDSASVSVSLSAAKEGVAAGGTFADTTTTAQAISTGIDGGEGNDTITNAGEINVAANSTSSSASIGATITGVKEGAGLGVSLTDGTTKAISAATGIKGGDGNNTITNSSNITATATSDSDSASVSATLGGASEGLVAGVSYADGTTTAEATAIGIETGSGNDTILNEQSLTVTSEATATSASVAVNAGGAVEGAAVGVALTDAETKAKSSSTGIEGGGGEDTLTNTGTIMASAKSDVTAVSVSVDFEATGTGLAGGAALANGDTTVEASAIGMDGGEGKGTISNDYVISVGAESTSTLASISVAVHGTPEGVSLGASLASASNTSKASVIGIKGGADDDKITNTGTITTSATTNADTTSVALDAELAILGLGASLARADTTAETTSAGLSGGAGIDDIENSGTIDVDSSATASSKAISVSIATSSYSSADVSTTARARSTGMEGGSGADLLRNAGTIDLNAATDADGKAGSANLTGYAAADVDITAEAATIGIDGGAEYNDIDNFVNTGTIKTVSDATAKGLAVSVNLLGGVLSNANTTARATTSGIKGGAGGDQIQNEGDIDLTAKSNADVTGVSVTLGGYADSNAESKGETIAKGIDGGDGENTITNFSTGSINISSEAYADTSSVSVNLLGYAKASGGATASATATGITGGKEKDTIKNEGTIDLTALSDTDASATTVQLIGYGESNAESKAEAIAKGIDGGDGSNKITNTSNAQITLKATTTANANSYNVNLLGGAAAKAGTSASANAIGIAGGEEIDSIQNEGLIDLSAQSNVEASSTSINVSGSGTANVASVANAVVAGIDGGKGKNTIINTNTGSIAVSSNASARAVGVTTNIGVGLSDAGTTSKTISTGIKSGEAGDDILNDGMIDVTTTASTEAGGGAVGLAEFSIADSLTEAIAEGINAGGGDDTIINTGTLTVGTVQDNDHPMAKSITETVSFSFFGFGSATLGAKAQATGIIGGGGDDTILNTRTLVVGDDDWMTKGLSSGITRSFLGIASAGTVNETTSKGIDAGEGEDTIVNADTGNMIVKATSYAQSTGSAESMFGDPIAKADSTAKASATGINGGEGNDAIENNGSIDVDAYARADGDADAEVGWGSPKAVADAEAEATGIGIEAGNGNHSVSNTRIIDVRAAANTIPHSESDTDVDDNTAQAYSDSTATAFGIKVGDGDDVIQNQGDIMVEAVAEKATPDDQRTTAWADEEAKVGTSKNDPGIKASATATGISAGGGKNQITNDETIDVKATGTGEGYSFAESDAYDTDTAIWAVVDATATGIATDTGNSQITNNELVKVSASATSQIYSDSDSVDDADAKGGATVSAKALGINARGSNTLVINADILDVDASATAEGNSRADSAGDGYGTAIFEPNSNADAVGIATGDVGTVWNQDQAQITVDAKAIINANANGDEFGTMGTGQNNPGARAAATAAGISMENGDNQIFNDGVVSVNAEGNINVGTRSLSTTRSTHTSTWARADATAAGFSTGKGNTSITNTGGLEVDAKAIAYLNDPNGGWGTYWRSDSWYNADAKTGAYAYSDAKGIDASADNKDNPSDIVITNSRTVKVSSAATAKGNAAGDRGGDNDGTATTYAEATADASGFVVGSGNKLVSIENSGTLEVTSSADTLAFAHGDTDSWTYAKSFGYAYGIKVGDDNELVSIKNSGTVKVESTATSDTADDEPWRQSDASSTAYGIDIGNSDSEIVNSGLLDITSMATAKLYTDESTAVSAVSSAYSTGVNTGNGTNTISNEGSILVLSNAENRPNGGNSNSTSIATAQATGIKTGSGSDTITSGANSMISSSANAKTFSYIFNLYNGNANASVIGIDAGDGANEITSHGTITTDADATAEVIKGIFSRTFPATANSNATGIKSGIGPDIIKNYGGIIVNSKSSAVINQVASSADTKSATANAIGIDAGGGDNSVANYGNIDVTALAAAGTGANPQARTDGVESTTAIGIRTGDGNDTIINSGKITATNQRLEWVGGGIHILDMPGTAITSGGGNDTVIFTEGSETKGSIELGDGDDALMFVNNPLVTGNLTGGAGYDTLVFDGAGDIGFTPAAFEDTIKQGAGTYTLPNLPTMQRIEVNQGTLQINSDYTMTNDSSFQAKVYGDGTHGHGTHGQLRVNGATILDGALKVIKGPGAYVNSTTYDILMGDTVNGWFTRETLPDPTPLVNFIVNPPRDHVEIKAQVNSFTTVSNNPTHNKIATHLDKILPTATGDLADVLGEIQLLSESGEFNTAFSSLSPDSYDNYTRGTLFTTQQYAKSLQYRMSNVRYHSMAGSPDNGKPILLAYNGSDASLGRLFTPGELSPIQGKSGLWLDVFGQWGDQDEEDGFTGYDYFLRGATLGFDHRLMDKLMAGLSLGYSRSDIDLDRDQGSGDVKGLFGSLYGSYFDRNLYVDAILSYGRNWYDNSRRITIGGILRRATSDHDAHLFSGYLGGGYYFDFNPWSVGPYGSLQYIRLDEESFEERGAGAISLRVDDRQTDALVSELGLRLVRLIKGKCGDFVPELNLAWSYDFDVDDRVVRASFAGSPGASFSIDGQDVEKHGAILGAGLTFVHQSGFSTSLRYRGEFREGYKSNGVMGELRYSF